MKKSLLLALFALIFGTMSAMAEGWPNGIKWETMQISAGGFYLHTDGTDSKIALNQNTTTFSENDLWYRVANEDGSYTIYNKAAGPDMVLAASKTMSGTTGGSTFPHMVAKDDVPSGYLTTWDLKSASNLLPEFGEEFYVYEHGTTYAMNNRDNYLAFWSTGQDAGSSVVFAFAEKTYEINNTTGGWTATNANGNWASNWASTDTDPTTVNVNCGVNNMTYTNGFITGYGGTALSSNYSFLTSDAQYVVSGCSFDLTFVDGASSIVTLTLEDGTAYKGSAEAQHVEVSGGKNQSYTMLLAGGNKGITFENLTITVQRSMAAQLASFKVFDNSGSIPYRIPSICTTAKGTLVAAADYRFTKADIGGGRLDLHIRTSNDNGETWNDVITPEEMTGDGNTAVGNQKCGYGDPCTVADRETGRIMLTSCSGTPNFFQGSRTHHQGWAQWYSDDEGQTWTQPRYLEEEFIYSKFDKSKYGQIVGWFVGSGKIHQSRYTKVGDYYRLYCAGSSYNGSETANWALYSDDFGQTWEFLGGCDASPVPGGDEPKVEELPNGNLVISSRNTSGRYYNIFSFTNMDKAEGSWGTKSLSSSAVNGLHADNGCNGEIQILPVVRKEDGQKTWLVLQSLPRGSGRTNVSIYYKDLEDATSYSTPANLAKNWNGYYVVSRVTSAYSTWSMCHNHTLGFLYEENSYNGGYDIVYKNISIETITDDAYSYDTEADPYTLPDNVKYSQQLEALLKDAEKAYEDNNGYIVSDGLIESADQLSCPFGQNDLGSQTDGGGLETLIDGNASTYYHTYWGGGDVVNGTHYLDIEAPETMDFAGTILIKVTRRAVANDHVTQFAVCACNDGESYDEIAMVDLDNATSGAKAEAQFDIEKGESYHYLRFIVTNTTNSRGYWHMAEFQLYSTQIDEHCFNAENPEAAAALAAAIEAAKEVTNASQEDVDALQSALDAYNNLVVGINTVIRPSTTATYDLSGRRVRNASNGLFIENGKKVIR